MYKVIQDFADLQDNNFVYHVGDIFPRDGIEISEERYAELSGRMNRRGAPVIQYIPEAPMKPSEGATGVNDINYNTNKKTPSKATTRKRKEK